MWMLSGKVYKTLLTTCVFLLVSCGVGAYPTYVTVAKDGSGDYVSIQSAIHAIKAFPSEPITLFVKAGIYEEKVNVFAWNTHLTLLGEGRDKTIIRFGDHFDGVGLGRNSTFHTYTLRIAANDFTAAHLTVENTAGPVGQAVALHVEADRAAFFDVAIKGHQDTLYVAGEGRRSYFSGCYIEGTVDFIFGEGTAYFNDCDIVSLRSHTYISAASTPADHDYGLVFDQCRFTASSDINQVMLGRTWRPHARTVIVNSWLGEHIDRAGWDDWNTPANRQTAFYAEGNNQGPGANGIERVAWSRQLSAQDMTQYQPSLVLRGWKPSLAD